MLDISNKYNMYSRRLWGYPWACRGSAGSRCRLSWCGAAAAARWPPGPPRPRSRAPPRRAVTSRGCSPCLQLMETEFNWGSFNRYPDINLCYASFYVSSNILQKYFSDFHWPQDGHWQYVSTLNPLLLAWSSRANKDGSKMEAEQYFSVVYNIFSSSSASHRSHHMTGPSLCHETLRHETLMESCGERKAKNNTTPSDSVYQLRYLHS